MIPDLRICSTGAAGLQQGDRAVAALVKAILPDGERAPGAGQLGRSDAGVPDRRGSAGTQGVFAASYADWPAHQFSL